VRLYCLTFVGEDGRQAGALAGAEPREEQRVELVGPPVADRTYLCRDVGGRGGQHPAEGGSVEIVPVGQIHEGALLGRPLGRQKQRHLEQVGPRLWRVVCDRLALERLVARMGKYGPPRSPAGADRRRGRLGRRRWIAEDRETVAIGVIPDP
jgi:hypothetical protein